MNKYNEVIFCDNIINKFKIKISNKLSKSKSFSKYYKDSLVYDKININKKQKIPKTNSYKLDKKKFIKLRNFSAKNKSNLFYLKVPIKGNYIQNILNEIIPKQIRKPNVVNLGYDNEFPKIYTKTETNMKRYQKKIENKNNKNKIIIKKASFLDKKLENVTNKYNIPLKKYKIKNMGYQKKLISNSLTPFHKFINRDFNITNKEYNNIIKNINDFNNSLNNYYK